MKYRIALGIVASLAVVFFVAHFLHSAPSVATVHGTEDDTDETPTRAWNNPALVMGPLQGPKIKYQVSSSVPQFVVLSFDGSKSVPMLNETLAFEQKMQAEGKPLHFTYFINAAYFLTNSNADLYQPPAGEQRGTSKIGFSDSTEDIALRVKGFNNAFLEGNEIGSHSVGHFDGSSWSYADWKQEFASFTSLMAGVRQNNPLVRIDQPIFLDDVSGFRAPVLGVNNSLYKVLGDSRFTYDTSGVNPRDAWPNKDTNGVWHIPLGTIFLGDNKNPVVSMDYNLWTRQSNARELLVKGTQEWTADFNQVEASYMDYFNSNYSGNRTPIIIGEHFSKWNDGLYWEAMKTFAENVCGKPQVHCITFKELVKYLDANGVPPEVN